MKTLQLSLALLLMILTSTDLTEGQMGYWSKCLGFPPSDSFRADDGKIVAWSPEDQRPGRAEYRTSSNPECVGYFASMSREVKRSNIFVLRQVKLNHFYHLRLPYKPPQRLIVTCINARHILGGGGGGGHFYAYINTIFN